MAKIIESHLTSLTRLSHNGVSIHFAKTPLDLCNVDLQAITNEMKTHLPFLYELLQLRTIKQKL